MRAIVLSLLLVGGCSSTRSKAPTTSGATFVKTAPTPFTAEQIRDAMPVGTEIKLRIDAPGKPVVFQQFVVINANAERATIASRVLDEQGEVAQDDGVQATRWDELVQHAAFPVEATTITDAEVTVPAGTYKTKHYEVREGDTVRKFHFALDLPGPPVDMTVEVGGKLVLRMVLVERR